MPTPLAAIAALVRAGAVERAWALFEADGRPGRQDDAGVLTVLGRLLKARARNATGAARLRLFGEAADAYARADSLTPAPYLAINAATLALLAGDPGTAAARARAVVEVLDHADDLADTPYYLAATRAEAQLVLGNQAAAERAMDEAIAHRAHDWADRATTIAQLREVEAALGEDAGWLDRFAPPASLHFAGHMGLVSGGEQEQWLTAAVDELIVRERIGFGWGALAAGVDVVVAERLLAAGAEVHAVLPCAPERFEAQSVAPAGETWLARYRAVFARARSVRHAAGDGGTVHEPIATAHAGELAIGAALLNARMLASTCCQLIVTDADGGGHNTARQAAMWPADAGPQHRMTIPRDAAIDTLFPPEEPDPSRALTLHVAIALDSLTRDRPVPAAEVEAAVKPVAAALSRFERSRVRSAPGTWELVLDDPDAALAALLAVVANCEAAGTELPSIGAHMAISHLISDPASGALVPYGRGVTLARRLQAMAPAGMILISDALAVTMVARGVSQARSEPYHLGDDDTQGAVHVLLRPV